jgi:crossover junction endodeoxyribonuclease RuvC
MTVERRAVRILGIDPGTRQVGYGILEAGVARRPEVVARGALRLPSRPLAARLEVVFREIERLIAAHRPGVLAIEEVFHGKNFQSVLKLGEARGVAILAAQIAGLEVREYPPATIKKAATGNGNATKAQVEAMMERILDVKGALRSADEADALAAAYCHSTRMGRASALARQAVLDVAASRKRPARALRERLVAAAASPRVSSRGRTPAAAAAALLESGVARVFRGARFRKAARRGGNAR